MNTTTNNITIHLNSVQHTKNNKLYFTTIIDKTNNVHWPILKNAFQFFNLQKR